MAIAITLSNGRTWRTKAASLSHFKAMLACHTDGAVVEDRNDHEDLVALLERYDEAITDGPSGTIPTRRSGTAPVISRSGMTVAEERSSFRSPNP